VAVVVVWSSFRCCCVVVVELAWPDHGLSPWQHSPEADDDGEDGGESVLSLNQERKKKGEDSGSCASSKGFPGSDIWLPLHAEVQQNSKKKAYKKT